MSYLRKIARDLLGVDIVFVIVSGQQHDEIEAGLRALFTSRFPGIEADCFLSFLGPDSVEAWLNMTRAGVALAPSEYGAAEDVIKDFIRLFGLQVSQVHLPPPPKARPDLTAVLRSVKILAPALPAQIAAYLQDQGFDIPSEKWLGSQMDILRKREYLIYQANGSYLPTERGLSMVPSGTSRSSSDVHRALVLGKKVW
jgi:hypothetical protein